MFAPGRAPDPLLPAPPRGSDASLSTAILERLERRLGRIEDQLSAGAPDKASEKSKVADNSTLTGVLQGDLLSDVLQLISSNELTGVFEIDGDGGKFNLFIEGGHIQHAEGGAGLSGESAFFAAFSCTTGRFRFHDKVEVKVEKTIDGNTQYLILEALRQIDESQADK